MVMTQDGQVPPCIRNIPCFIYIKYSKSLKKANEVFAMRGCNTPGKGLQCRKEVSMKAKVDKDLCTGCELCTDDCPAVFKMDGDTATAFADPVPADAEECAREAVDQCPVEAISIEE
jgi:ferredoxin